MSRRSDFFDENTILSTPNPIHSSSICYEGKSKSSETSRRANSLEPSGGGKSGKRLSEAGEKWRRERLLASTALNRIDSIEKLNEEKLFGLPSRFLRPSETSTSSLSNLLHSESTINESDLLMPGNSSTPRESILSNLEHVRKAPSRQSMGSSITQLASSMRDPTYDWNDFMENIHKTMDLCLSENSFRSGEEVLRQLEQDEVSWKQKQDIPAELRDFSVVAPSFDQKLQSIGSFFKQRSDNLSTILAKSPEKVPQPIPLVEISLNDTIGETNDSLSISKIARILSDTQQTPTKAANYFLNTKRKSSQHSSPYETKENTAGKNSNVKTIHQIIMNKSDPKPSSVFRKSPTLELCEEGRKESLASGNNSRRSDVKMLEEAVDKSKRQSRSPTFSKSPMRELCQERKYENLKENISPDFHQESVSLRSSSALSNLPDGKLPIATTQTEIIWGCIKPGKNVSQDFIIKNKSLRRIAIVCTVSNPSFRLIKEGSEINISSSIKLNMHPYETRNVTVTFAPTAVGAAVDYLQFTPVDLSHQQVVKQHVKLFGYGGHGNVTINNIIKDISGKFLLSLGNINNFRAIRKQFTLKNNGTLPSFANIVFVSSGLHLFSSVKVAPQVLVLLPKEEREVIVSYEPRKEDFNYIHSKNNCVIDMGKLAVTSGTEADRGRLRRLYKKGVESGLQIDPVIGKLVEKFPGEVMPNDLKLLKESVQSMDQILRQMNTTEVIITVEQDLDGSMVEFQNETVMFHSLCQNTLLESTIRTESCSVEPSKIILKPPNKVSDMIFIKNNSQKQVYLEIYSKPEGLRFDTREGTIDPGKSFIVHVTCNSKCKEIRSFNVKVLVESEAYDVNVKVIV